MTAGTAGADEEGRSPAPDGSAPADGDGSAPADADGGTPPAGRGDLTRATDGGTTDPGPTDGEVDTERLAELLDEIEELTDTEAEREQVRETVETELDIRQGPFGRVIRGFDRSDLAEAFLGSVVFGIPMAVESGTQEIGVFLSTRPLAIELTVLFTVALVVGIVYVSDFQDVRVQDPILGIVPRRLVGILSVSFGSAVVMLTLWGRVDWATPLVALATCTVAFVPMAVGAALSDLLPGT